MFTEKIIRSNFFNDPFTEQKVSKQKLFTVYFLLCIKYIKKIKR